MIYDVFISYSTKDKKVVEGICGYLERYGYRCFVAYRDINPGISWPQAIPPAIRESSLMVVVFSEEFNSSEQTDRELTIAVKNGKTIIPFRISDVDMTGTKEYVLSNLNWIDAFPDPERYFGRLKEAVSKVIGQPATPNGSVSAQTTVLPPKPTQLSKQIHKSLPEPKPTPILQWRKWLKKHIAVVVSLLLIVGVVIVWLSRLNKTKSSNEDIEITDTTTNDSMEVFDEKLTEIQPQRVEENDGTEPTPVAQQMSGSVSVHPQRVEKIGRTEPMPVAQQMGVAVPVQPVHQEGNSNSSSTTLQKKEVSAPESSNSVNVRHENGIIINVNGVEFKMVKVEGGKFMMGAQKSDPKSPNYHGEAEGDESPVHEVELSDYYIGETEVTQALWKAVMRNNPSWFKGDDNLPVEFVSWEDIVEEFIPALNRKTGRTFRLPTEAEWEYAARGGNKSKGYKYSGSDNIDEVAWYGGNSRDRTHPVKGKMANELGLYDMSGNVAEWCSDWYGDYSSGAQTNPRGSSKGSFRVVRDGGWWVKVTKWCHVSCRGKFKPGYYCSLNGFRLVLCP